MPAFPPTEGPILLLAPHPDDETIGVGGWLSHICARGQEVWVVVVTAGDAFRWRLPQLFGGPAAQLALGSQRLREARLACARLGVRADRVALLGFPDQGLTALLDTRWTVPYRSPATGARSVPYGRAWAPGTPHTGEALVGLLESLTAHIQPAWVLAPGPLDGHGDHRALSRLAGQLVAPGQLLYYPAEGEPGWPFPKGDHPDWPLIPPPAYGDAPWRPVPLDAAARAAKRAALAAHASQLGLLAPALRAYLRANELLLPAGRDPR